MTQVTVKRLLLALGLAVESSPGIRAAAVVKMLPTAARWLIPLADTFLGSISSRMPVVAHGHFV